MKRILTNLCLTVVMLLAPLAILAQPYLGFVNSNYSGVHGILMNPASIVDMRYKVDINLISLHNTFRNNYIALEKKKLMQNYDSSLDFQKNYLYERISDENKFVYMNTDILGPSFAFNINRKNSLAFFTRMRSVFNADNITPALAKLSWEGLDYPDLWKLQLQNERFNFQYMAWGEYGFTYGREVIQINKHYLKAAVSVKLLQGLGAAYIYVDDLDYEFANDDTLSLFNSDVKYGHSTNFEFDTESFQYDFISNPTLGFDLGFVYEWRKDEDEYTYSLDGKDGLTRRDMNKYKLKVGLSILDIGRIRFQKGDVSGNFLADIDDYYIGDFNVNSVEDFNDTIEKNFNFTQTTGEYFKMKMPTTLNIQVDYNIWKGFYVNYTQFVSFRRKNQESKLRQQTTFSITPRFEHKWFDFALPLIVSPENKFQLGTSIRLAFLVIGTNDLASFWKDRIYGNDFYVAIKIPVPFGKPKDKDKDGVSNKKDNCKDKPGTWATMGCPDTDGDGILDNEDLCPKEPGPKENSGCPYADRDKDGVLDKDDECPDVAGLVENKGCPIADKDGDGVLDKDDDCIDVPGPADNRGCPKSDQDRDGILDADDQCIDVPGPKENNGCPWPDTDGDTVLDKDDDCPKTPGPVENKGCPIIEEKDQVIVNTAFENLEFETGKTIIKSKSFASLYELANVLDQNPTWKLRIAGHTDNVGNDTFNLDLSKRRAEAVAKVFKDRGIDPSRIIIEYYGESQPIDTNDTPEGRANNRRVEMEIVFD